MGQRVLKSLGSAPGFLSMGVMTVVLKDEGTIQKVREECIIPVIKEDREGRQALTRTLERGSNYRYCRGHSFLNKVSYFSDRRNFEV